MEFEHNLSQPIYKDLRLTGKVTDRKAIARYEGYSLRDDSVALNNSITVIDLPGRGLIRTIDLGTPTGDNSYSFVRGPNSSPDAKLVLTGKFLYDGDLVDSIEVTDEATRVNLVSTFQPGPSNTTLSNLSGDVSYHLLKTTDSDFPFTFTADNPPNSLITITSLDVGTLESPKFELTLDVSADPVKSASIILDGRYFNLNDSLVVDDILTVNLMDETFSNTSFDVNQYRLGVLSGIQSGELNGIPLSIGYVTQPFTTVNLHDSLPVSYWVPTFIKKGGVGVTTIWDTYTASEHPTINITSGSGYNFKLDGDVIMTPPNENVRDGIEFGIGVSGSPVTGKLITVKASEDCLINGEALDFTFGGRNSSFIFASIVDESTGIVNWRIVSGIGE